MESHTIDPSRLRGGWALDAGCRDFLFSKALTARGCKVVALDPDPEIEDPKIDGVTFVRAGLAVEKGGCDFVLMENPEMRHLSTAGFVQWRDVKRVSVDALSIADLMERFDVKVWDCVKLDVEGSEYGILENWPGPVAEQITCEFHDHMEIRSPEVYERILAHLGKWYDVAVRSPQDNLFVLRHDLSGAAR